MAERDGAIVVYPQGVSKSWNDGRGAASRTVAGQRDVDDVGFLRRIVGELAKQPPIDFSRVCATGISNGGLMSFRLACDASETFTAVAPVTANMSKSLPARSPQRPSPCSS